MIDWEQVRVRAAIAAMQGIQESGKIEEAMDPVVVSEMAVRFTDALVKRLKETAPRKNLGRKPL